MRELIAKIGRFCENHVEKIVLVVVAPVCAYLFFTKVIFSPNAVLYDGKMLNPGRIDEYVAQKAGELRDALADDKAAPGQGTYTSLITGPIEPNNPVVADVFVDRLTPRSFMSLFEDPLSFMGASAPTVRPTRSAGGPKYALPPVGPVTDVKVNHIRAAAYVPVAPVTAQTSYARTENEPNDIDLVTVEAKFNVAELYRQFHAYFDGTEVEKPAWRDPCLAVPKFAAVQLQRQVQSEGGAWGDWMAVPRSRIEQQRELFTPIERVEDLPPGGVRVRLMQLDSRPVTMALLQPEAYQIASAEEDWFPPSFYDKFKTLQRKVELDQRRQEREERKNEQESAATTGGRRDDARGTGRDNRLGGATARRDGRTGGDGLYGGGDRRSDRSTRTRGTGTDTTTTGRTRGRRDTTADTGLYDARDPYGRGEDGTRVVSTDEAYLDFAEALMTYTTDLAKLTEPLLFWAFDDTAEPGKTYRYRIRLGVLNPVAGTDQLIERDMDKKDQVILWSGFSGVTPAVSIPKRLYFFAKDVQDRTKAATVEVARYALGYWYTQDFQVRPGEVIGREMEPPKKKDEDKKSLSRLMTVRITGSEGRGAASIDPRAMEFQTLEPVDPTTPQMVDYGTNIMLVDLVETSDLGTPPNLRPRPYYDMLYSGDGVTIEHMPVSQKNWPKDLVVTYQGIVAERTKEHQDFRAFRANRGTGDGRGGVYGPYGGR